MDFSSQNPFLKDVSGFMIMSAQAFWLWVGSGFLLGAVFGYGAFWGWSLSYENKRLKSLMGHGPASEGGSGQKWESRADVDSSLQPQIEALEKMGR